MKKRFTVCPFVARRRHGDRVHPSRSPPAATTKSHAGHVGLGTADSTTPTGDATTDDDGSVPSDRGNIVFNVAFAGASKGALTCLVIGDLGPAAQKNVTAPVYPQKVEANNIKPGDYKAVCYIDANGNEQADDLDPKGPPGPPRTVTVKAGEPTTEDIVVNDPEPETDAGTDAGDAGDAGDGAP